MESTKRLAGSGMARHVVNERRRWKSLAVSVVAAALGAAITSDATASYDGPSGTAGLPATACTPGLTSRTFSYTKEGYAKNVSGSTTSIVCPVEMPRVANQGQNVEVLVRAQSGTFACALRLMNPAGSIVATDSASLSGEDDYEWLEVEVPYPTNVYTATLVCDLDDDEGIKSYGIVVTNFY